MLVEWCAVSSRSAGSHRVVTSFWFRNMFGHDSVTCHRIVLGLLYTLIDPQDEVYVYGLEGKFISENDQLSNRLPIFFCFVEPVGARISTRARYRSKVGIRGFFISILTLCTFLFVTLKVRKTAYLLFHIE